MTDLRHREPAVILAPEDALIGQLLGGRYQVESKIGQGSMGVVYRGVQVPLQKRVAIKVLTHEGYGFHKATERFLQEARIAATLKHPSIAEVYDFAVTEEGAPYYVMEYLEGTDLARRLSAVRPLPLKEAVSIARAVAAGLAVAHAAGIVHRDIKPENIYLVPQPTGGEVVKVVDFGISKVLFEDGLGSKLTMPGTVCGSPQYMSPEQAAGREVDARSDIYSLGVVLYEMLCGRVPFDAPEPVRILTMHLADPPPRPSSAGPGLAIPPALEALVMRALAKNKEERFASMTELEAALAAALPALPSGNSAQGEKNEKKATSEGWPPAAIHSEGDPPTTGDRDPGTEAETSRAETELAMPAQAEARRRGKLLAAAALVLLLGVGLLLWILSRPEPPAQTALPASSPDARRPDAAPAARLDSGVLDSSVVAPSPALPAAGKKHRRAPKRAPGSPGAAPDAVPAPDAAPARGPGYRLDDLKPLGPHRPGARTSPAPGYRVDDLKPPGKKKDQRKEKNP